MEERNRQIAELLRDNLSLTLEEIGQQVGMTRERVRQIALKYGVVRKQQLHDVRRDGSPRGQSLCRLCETWYLTGYQGRYDHTRTENHREGILRNPDPRAKSDRDLLVVALYEAGLKGEEIVAALIDEGYPPDGLFPEMTYRVLKRYGIKPHHGGGRYVRLGRQWMDSPDADAMVADYQAGIPPKDLFAKYWPARTGANRHASLYYLLRDRGITFRQIPALSVAIKVWNAAKKGEKTQKSA